MEDILITIWKFDPVYVVAHSKTIILVCKLWNLAYKRFLLLYIDMPVPDNPMNLDIARMDYHLESLKVLSIIALNIHHTLRTEALLASTSITQLFVKVYKYCYNLATGRAPYNKSHECYAILQELFLYAAVESHQATLELSVRVYAPKCILLFTMFKYLSRYFVPYQALESFQDSAIRAFAKTSSIDFDVAADIFEKECASMRGWR